VFIVNDEPLFWLLQTQCHPYKTPHHEKGHRAVSRSLDVQHDQRLFSSPYSLKKGTRSRSFAVPSYNIIDNFTLRPFTIMPDQEVQNSLVMSRNFLLRQ